MPEIKELYSIDDNATRKLTFDITEKLKQIVYQHIKDNYKVIIQVITYSKKNEEYVSIKSQCLWNYKTDDVLAFEIETDRLKFFIIIYGVIS